MMYVFGMLFKVGDLVLFGVLGLMVVVSFGDVFEMCINGFGFVCVVFDYD